MKKILRVLVPAVLLLIAPVFAQAAVDDFQVTGNVTEKTADSITVMKTVKGKQERFQIAIDKETKMTGDAKVGDTVTIKYKMHASSIEAKAAAAKEAKPKKK